MTFFCSLSAFRLSLLLLLSPPVTMSLTTTEQSSRGTVLPFSQRPYDLIVYGATGYTGQIAAEYLHKHYRGKVRFALAGRNQAKLQQLRSRLLSKSRSTNGIAQQPEKDYDIPILVADAVRDPESLQTLASSSKVIANYAGSPFMDKALPVVQACVEHGTCYTDITGEVPFQRASQDLYHKAAMASRALIVHACGYDSIPSDIGAFMASKAMRERYQTHCESLEMVVGSSRGGVSGGTLLTAMELMTGSEKYKHKIPSWSYNLVDGTAATETQQEEHDTVSFVTYDQIAKSYVMPFFMAKANAPVVRKSISLLGYGCENNYKCGYREVVAVPNYFVGLTGTLSLIVGGLSILFPPTRWFLTQFILPRPGQGPSREMRDSGYFASQTFATGTNPKNNEPVTTEAYVKSGNAGDPGYKATAQMSVEASLCMALEREACREEGGVLTPAVALGDTLVKRLNQSGMEVGIVGRQNDDSANETLVATTQTAHNKKVA